MFEGENTVLCKPKTPFGCSPASGYLLEQEITSFAGKPARTTGSRQSPAALHPALTHRRSRKTYWIADEVRKRILSRKERKDRKGIFKTSRTSSAAPHLRVRLFFGGRNAREPGSSVCMRGTIVLFACRRMRNSAPDGRSITAFQPIFLSIFPIFPKFFTFFQNFSHLALHDCQIECIM